MKYMIKKFLRDEDGAALVEYGVALLVVILAGTGGLLLVANNTEARFDAAATATAAPAAGTTGTTGTTPP